MKLTPLKGQGATVVPCSPGAEPFEPCERPERIVEGGDTGRRVLRNPALAGAPSVQPPAGANAKVCT